MGRQKDIRMMMVYGYGRLAGYDRDLRIVSDILESVEAEDQRVFTLRLRKGHRWSDGAPFTAEDFRYYWEDVVNDEELSPFGPPKVLIVDGEPPRFEVLDERTVRYSWSNPNPYFLPALAGARPMFIYRPAHYLKRFHARYAEPAALEALVKEASQRNWAGLHHRMDQQYRFDNVDMPCLQPWINTTRPPAERFVFKRNPYYHRADAEGRQLPYIDEVIVNIADNSLIPAKTGFGESDLQARYIRFDHYTFLKKGEKAKGFTVRLWPTASGSKVALFPNLNVEDPVWRALNRDVRFRRALSLAINRQAINQVLYFGLARPSANTVLPESPLFKEAYQTAWARLDVKKANALLDEARRDRAHQAQRQGHPDAARRPGAPDHHRHGRREHRGIRRARADQERLGQDRRRAVHQALAARGVPQPGVRRCRGHVDLVGAGERAADRGYEPAGTGADRADPATMAEMGRILRNREELRARAGHAGRPGAPGAQRGLAPCQDHGRARGNLAQDAEDQRRSGALHRPRQRGPAAGRGQQRGQERARAGRLQLGPGRLFRHLPAGNLLARREAPIGWAVRAQERRPAPPGGHERFGRADTGGGA
jgi:hypothetical protein